MTSPMLVRLAAFLAGLLALTLLELERPFAPRIHGPRRRVTNLLLGTFNALGLGVAAALLAPPVPEHGLLAPLPAAARFAVALVLLDLVLWWWHVANHRLSWLWRFHRLHHSDPELDVTSAARFHLGELVGGHFVTGIALALLGTDGWTNASAMATTSFVSQLQHANVAWPDRLEAGLARIFVPPSLHAIHHAGQTDLSRSNYGTLFSIWDRLAGTLRISPPRHDVRVGLSS